MAWVLSEIAGNVHVTVPDIRCGADVTSSSRSKVNVYMLPSREMVSWPAATGAYANIFSPVSLNLTYAVGAISFPSTDPRPMCLLRRLC